MPAREPARRSCRLTSTPVPKSSCPAAGQLHGVSPLVYAESCLQTVGEGLRSGDLLTPEDGPIAWIAKADLAEADAAILASAGQWDGITPPMTEAAALTMADVARIAS